MESAILTESRDADCMYKKVKYLLDNEDELKRISENGYKKVREFFNWDKSVSEFEKVLLN